MIAVVCLLAGATVYMVTWILMDTIEDAWRWWKHR